MKKTFAKYVCMSVLGMMGLSLYILADTWFVAQAMGANGLAALNLAIPVYSLINGAGLLLGIGGGAVYTLCISRGDGEAARAAYTGALCMAIFPAAAGAAAGAFFADAIAAGMGAQGEVQRMTEVYLRVILLGTPLFLLNNVLLGFVRNDGAPQRAMAAMVAGSLSNIALDWLFMFPLKMGIFGAALATCFAPVISLAVMSPHFRGKRCGLRMARRTMGKLNVQMICAGLPSFAAEVSAGVMMMVFNALVMEEAGTVGVAAYGVVANLALVVTAIFTGVAQGAQPLLSRAHGSENAQEERGIQRLLFGTMLVLAAGIYACVLLGADAVAGAFNSQRDAQLQQMAVQGLKLYFVSCPFAAVNIALCMALTCAQRCALAQGISLARGFIVLLPVVWLFAGLWGLAGIWCALPAAEAAVCVGGLVLRKYRKSYCRT